LLCTVADSTHNKYLPQFSSITTTTIHLQSYRNRLQSRDNNNNNNSRYGNIFFVNYWNDGIKQAGP
jgi:hypothetical protein